MASGAGAAAASAIGAGAGVSDIAVIASGAGAIASGAGAVASAIGAIASGAGAGPCIRHHQHHKHANTSQNMRAVHTEGVDSKMALQTCNAYCCWSLNLAYETILVPYGRSQRGVPPAKGSFCKVAEHFELKTGVRVAKALLVTNANIAKASLATNALVLKVKWIDLTMLGLRIGESAGTGDTPSWPLAEPIRAARIRHSITSIEGDCVPAISFDVSAVRHLHRSKS